MRSLFCSGAQTIEPCLAGLDRTVLRAPFGCSGRGDCRGRLSASGAVADIAAPAREPQIEDMPRR